MSKYKTTLCTCNLFLRDFIVDAPESCSATINPDDLLQQHNFISDSHSNILELMISSDINPFMPSGLSHPSKLYLNSFPKLGMSGIFISIFRIFLTEIPLSKQRQTLMRRRIMRQSHLGSTLFAKAFFLDARQKWVNLRLYCISL